MEAVKATIRFLGKRGRLSYQRTVDQMVAEQPAAEQPAAE
jgi:hypothetical protein